MAYHDAVLTVIDSCDGCGACCMHMNVPSGYDAIVQGYDWPIDKDAKERVAALPAEARQLIEEYIADVDAGRKEETDNPCVWLDMETRACRFYEYRPRVCRDFDRGTAHCLGHRAAREIPLTTEQQQKLLTWEKEWVS